MSLFYLITLAAMVVVVLCLVYYLIKERGHSASAKTELSLLRTGLGESKTKNAQLEEELKTSVENKTKLSLLQTELEESKTKNARLEEKLNASEKNEGNLQAEISKLSTIIQQERKTEEEKTAILSEAKKSLKQEFENLGNEIFKKTSEEFLNKNKTGMDDILKPLEKDIKDFKQTVTATHESATIQRTSLQTHIENLKNLGEKMSQEANRLTTALKGESQTQGRWGEIVLKRALEMSGLKEGVEYESQQSYKGFEGEKQRPDVVVHLPEGKDVIIDSKVSLTAYEGYVSCEDEKEREEFLTRHITSIRNHIKELSDKGYETIPEIKSLNYVLMFVPIEPAFMLAISKEKNLYEQAFEKNIIIVCPSTLLATLRIIHNIWKVENQNANAREIAEQAGRMLEKFMTFTEYLTEIGRRISQSQEAYDKATRNLYEGHGNLIGMARRLKDLGVKPRKEFSAEIEKRSKFAEDLVVLKDSGSDEQIPEPVLKEKND